MTSLGCWVACGLAVFGNTALVPGVEPGSGNDVVAQAAGGGAPVAGVFESVGLPYEGYGSVTVLGDGVVIVRIDGDAPSGKGEFREPIAKYVLVTDPASVSLVCAAGECFIDRAGADLARRGLSMAEATVLPFATSTDGESGECAREALLTIAGDMLFDWVPEAGYGYLEIVSAGASTTLELDLGSSWGMPYGGWQPWCCSVECGFFSHCGICCGLLEYAQCYCNDDGEAVCECLPREGSAYQFQGYEGQVDGQVNGGAQGHEQGKD